MVPQEPYGCGRWLGANTNFVICHFDKLWYINLAERSEKKTVFFFCGSGKIFVLTGRQADRQQT